MIIVNARFLTQPCTGVQRYAFEMCKQLQTFDEPILFVCPANIRQTQWAEQLKAKVIGRLKGHMWEQVDLPLFLRTQDHPVLFSPCNTGPLFYRRQVLTIHDLAFKFYPQFNSFLFRSVYNFLVPRLIKKVHHICTVSETVRQEICNTYPMAAHKISVTYNTVSPEMQLSPTRKLQKEKIILTVGSLNGRKNIDLLISGFLASGLYPTYTLIIIGSRNPIYRFPDAQVHAGVQFIAEMSDELLKDYYAHAEIACFLSLYEGFGIPILESLQYGCKVLCADIPVFRELYESYVTFCDPHAADQLKRILPEMPSKAPLNKEQLLTLNQRFQVQHTSRVLYEILRNA